MARGGAARGAARRAADRLRPRRARTGGASGRSAAQAPRRARARARRGDRGGGSALRAVRPGRGRGRGHRRAAGADRQGPRARRRRGSSAAAGRARPPSSTRRCSPAPAAITRRSMRPRCGCVAATSAAHANSPRPCSSCSPRSARTPITRRPQRPRRICCSAATLPGRRSALRRAAAARHGEDYGGACDHPPAAAHDLRAAGGRRAVPGRPRRSRASSTSAGIGSPTNATSGRFPRGDEGAVAARIAEVVARHAAGFAYGSLASGADILWAEALLAAGSELHVVLPFAREEFIALVGGASGAGGSSGSSAAPPRRRRSDYATDDAFLGDDVLFRYGTRARDGTRAAACPLPRRRGAPAGASGTAGRPNGAAGTSIDIATWRRRGRPCHVGLARHGEARSERTARTRRPDQRRPRGGPAASAGRAGRARDAVRRCQGVLEVDRRAAAGLRSASAWRRSRAVTRQRHSDIWYRNTWGDAVYVVLSDVFAGCRIARSSFRRR